MFSYNAYKVLHLFGIILLFVALGGLTLHAINGGTKETNRSRKLVAISHGLALFIVILGGFGLLARIGVAHGTSWPGWVWGKLLIWVLMGAALVIPNRKPEWARGLWITLPVLGGIAAWLAIYKPF